MELNTFEGLAKEQLHVLKWTTISEANLAYFGVEQSLDGQHFAEIGTIKAYGNSQEEKRCGK